MSSGEIPHYTTGFDIDDELIGGGVPAGTVITLETSPQSPGRAAVHNTMATRETVYFTTQDTPAMIRRIHEQKQRRQLLSTSQRSDVEYGEVRVYDVQHQDDPIGYINSVLQGDVDDGIERRRNGAVSDPINIVVDAVDPFEDDSDEYRTLLTTFNDVVKSVGGVGLLRCLSPRGERSPVGRRFTLAHSEMVLRFDHISDVTDSVEEDYLSVGKTDFPVAIRGNRRTFEIDRDRLEIIADVRRAVKTGK